MIKDEGLGWRIARDPNRETYTTLIGGETWAFEITDPEWNSLSDLLNQLIDQYKQIKNQLMKDEPIVLEIEKHPWKGFLEGDQFSWSLKLILKSQEESRGVEMFWPSTVAESVTLAMRKMWDSN